MHAEDEWLGRAFNDEVIECLAIMQPQGKQLG